MRQSVVVASVAAALVAGFIIGDTLAANLTALEPAAPVKHRMLRSKRDHAPGELQQILIDVFPVQP